MVTKATQTQILFRRFETGALMLPPIHLGRCLKEYVAESNHGGWDGWTPEQQNTIAKFLIDVLTCYYQQDPKNFDEITNVNPL